MRGLHFEPLRFEIVERIVDKFVNEVQIQLTEKNIQLELTPEARAWLAQKGYDNCMAHARWHA